MAGIRLSLPGLNGKSYYRAEVRENKRLVAQLPGKYNSREQLDKFLELYFPWHPAQRSVEKWEDEISLKVWKYHGNRLSKIETDIQMPKPIPSENDAYIERMIKEVSI